MKRCVRHLLVVLIVVIWIGAVAYPSPRPFIVSIERLRRPPLDPAAAANLAATLPNDYKAIEDFVAGYVPWTPAWTVYNLPWYFPTVKETLEHRSGDCQAQATLMASILEAKGMKYTLMYSLDHVWVDYPGRAVTKLEDPATSFVSNAGSGWLGFLPKKFPLWTIIKTRVNYHWTPMPLPQKLLIVLGSLVIIGYGHRRFFSRFRRLLWWPLAASRPDVPGSPECGRSRSR